MTSLVCSPGCEVGSEVTGCANRWAQFSWKYTKPDKLKEIKIPSKSIKITCNNAIKGRCHCYHDTKSATVWLVIKELRQNDAGEYSCILDKGRTESVKLELNGKRQYVTFITEMDPTGGTKDPTGGSFSDSTYVRIHCAPVTKPSGNCCSVARRQQ